MFYREKQDNKTDQLFLLENQVNALHCTISKLKEELEKYYANDVDSTKIVLIGDPNKINNELNHEVECGRSVFTKLSQMFNSEKNKNQALEQKIGVFI